MALENDTSHAPPPPEALASKHFPRAGASSTSDIDRLYSQALHPTVTSTSS